jgi:two-component system cell cycle response regulator
MSQVQKPASILIVDDSETIRNRIKKVLVNQKGLFEKFYEAEDGAGGFKILLNQKVDIILCDIVMPQIDGFKLLAMVKNHPEMKGIPIIMLTAEGEQDKKNQALEKGASDYLTKPFDEIELLARVRVHLALKLLQDELRETNKQLTVLSNTDALTQVFNRRHLMKMMVNEILRTNRYKTELSFLLIDIDNFKSVNDTYGHQAGDQILIDLCLRIGGVLRRTDVLARYGGEEFAILLYQVPLAGAEKVAEKIRFTIAEKPFQIGEKKVDITISCGISSYVEETTDTIDTIIMEADRALYEAKGSGKNKVVVSKICLEAAAVSKHDEDE